MTKVSERLEQLLWHYTDIISEAEEKQRLGEIRKILQESNTSASQARVIFKDTCQRKHLCLIDALSKLAVEDFTRRN